LQEHDPRNLSVSRVTIIDLDGTDRGVGVSWEDKHGQHLLTLTLDQADWLVRQVEKRLEHMDHARRHD